MPGLHLTTFSCDVTPPLGHPLCGGWIEPVRAVDDPLRALAVILLGAGAPIVLCAVDWCGVRNDANWQWRQALAKAAHTVPERVAVHCLHAHNAPFADTGAERLIETVPGAPRGLNLQFFNKVVAKNADSAKKALATTQRFTHIGIGQAKVNQVASNRRMLGDNGKVQYVRYSATKDPKIRKAPEGLIDPWLKVLSFWNESKPLVVMSYYATHPMSYYGDGRVTSDFCGLARDKRQIDDPSIFQVYFTGCAGNVTAGKYNDGSRAKRPVLRDRVYDAMKKAWDATKRYPISDFAWRSEELTLPARHEASFSAVESRKVLDDPKQAPARRGNAAFQMAWLQRDQRPIDITCLDLGQAQVLHLPGEPFVEYQLTAQEMRTDSFVCVAGYGDGGPGYIPTAPAFLQGGYEPTVALAAPESETILLRAMSKVLSKS